MERIIEKDCCFEQDNFWFRYRAASVIIEDNCVLMVYNNADNYYYSIGGGVHLGETSAETVAREVMEETGITYRPERLIFINESLFYGHGSLVPGRQCHIIEFFYLMETKGRKLFKDGEERKIIPEPKDKDRYPEPLYWIPLEKLADVKAFPEFFKEKLFNIPDSIEHFISEQRSA